LLFRAAFREGGGGPSSSRGRHRVTFERGSVVESHPHLRRKEEGVNTDYGDDVDDDNDDANARQDKK